MRVLQENAIAIMKRLVLCILRQRLDRGSIARLLRQGVQVVLRQRSGPAGVVTTRCQPVVTTPGN